ncbi:MAG: hypothetical protein V3V63_01805, partial [Candidatus Hydrothermarchaeaceae archaeon]
MGKARVLVVEDEAIIANDLKGRLKNAGYVVSSVVASGEEAVMKAEEDAPDTDLKVRKKRKFKKLYWFLLVLAAVPVS